LFSSVTQSQSIRIIFVVGRLCKGKSVHRSDISTVVKMYTNQKLQIPKALWSTHLTAELQVGYM
jgi:hypothetical protein